MLDPITFYVLLVLFLATVIRSAFGFGEIAHRRSAARAAEFP